MVLELDGNPVEFLTLPWVVEVAHLSQEILTSDRLYSKGTVKAYLPSSS
jgi:hypothetical protein